MQLFKLAFEALMCDNVNEKLSLTSQLNSCDVRLDSITDKFNVKKINIPGRPLKPKLVSFKTTPKRDRSDIGMVTDKFNVKKINKYLTNFIHSLVS
jgi:uncharacterized ferritin-like protein (DUF455 family)